MSKITIVMDDEKPYTKNSDQSEKSLVLTQESSMTLMSVLLKNRLLDASLCGGRGDCGRCAVQFLEGAPLPTAIDRACFSPGELRQGHRLSCMAKPKTDCVVRLLPRQEGKLTIVTEMTPVSENIDLSGQQNFSPENRTSGAMESGKAACESDGNPIKNSSVISGIKADVMESAASSLSHGFLDNKRYYIIAVDLGTTTIAMQLREGVTGRALSTYCEKNQQRSYGADVLSRVQASRAGAREALQRLACEALLRGLRQFFAHLRQEENEKRADGALDGTEAMDAVWRGASKVGAKRGVRGNKAPLGQAVGADGSGEPRICMCIAGNTAMGHLLLGYDVEGLGKSPFTPVEIGLQALSASRLFACLEDVSWQPCQDGWQLDSLEAAPLPDFPVYIAPGISAFVGGDIVAGLYALSMLPAKQPAPRRGAEAGREGAEAAPSGEMTEQGSTEAEQRSAEAGQGRETAERTCAGTVAWQGIAGEDDKKQTAEREKNVRLLIDLGTNGELAITDGERMLVSATAAGPAFEGGPGEQFFGADRIAIVDKLLRQGMLDRTGLLADPWFAEGVQVEIGEDGAARLPRAGAGLRNICYLTQKDIRALQMAKAAIRAGVEILWEEMGRPLIWQVYLAGGFGYYLDAEAALSIGLLPDRLRGRIQAVGNTALEGAFLLGRDLALAEKAPEVTSGGTGGFLLREALERGQRKAPERAVQEEMQERQPGMDWKTFSKWRDAKVRSINLARQGAFEALYLRYLDLEPS